MGCCNWCFCSEIRQTHSPERKGISENFQCSPEFQRQRYLFTYNSIACPNISLKCIYIYKILRCAIIIGPNILFILIITKLKKSLLKCVCISMSVHKLHCGGLSRSKEASDHPGWQFKRLGVTWKCWKWNLVLCKSSKCSYSWSHRPSLQVNKSLNCFTLNHDCPTPELLAFVTSHQKYLVILLVLFFGLGTNRW